MKFNKQPAYINIEQGIIYYSSLEINSIKRYTPVSMVTELNAINLIIQDCRKVIEQAEAIKKAAEEHKNNLNQKSLF
jgi:hypothetical protein